VRRPTATARSRGLFRRERNVIHKIVLHCIRPPLLRAWITTRVGQSNFARPTPQSMGKNN
jgi:hypothetical protein